MRLLLERYKLEPTSERKVCTNLQFPVSQPTGRPVSTSNTFHFANRVATCCKKCPVQRFHGTPCHLLCPSRFTSTETDAPTIGTMSLRSPPIAWRSRPQPKMPKLGPESRRTLEHIVACQNGGVLEFCVSKDAALLHQSIEFRTRYSVSTCTFTSNGLTTPSLITSIKKPHFNFTNSESCPTMN